MQERVKNPKNNDTVIKLKNSVSRYGQCLGMTIDKQTISFFKYLLLCVALLIGGALLFSYIESGYENRTIEKVNLEYLIHKDEVFNIIHNAIERGNTSQVEEVISSLKEHVAGLEERNTDPPRQWAFINSLLFSFTVMSTIGYGRHTPSTTGGRIFLIVYAIIGIPLTAFFLAQTAERCLYAFKWLSQVKVNKVEQIFNYFDKDNSGELDQEEFKNAMEEFGFKLTSEELEEYWYIIDFDGSGTLDLDEFKEVVTGLSVDVIEFAAKAREIRITLIAMFTWIGIGVLSFSFIENWTPFISFYFLIVSLTTIGLGDFIPQTKTGTIFLIVYAATGLGLVALGLTMLGRHFDGFPRERVKSFKITYLKSKFKKKMKQIPNFASLSNDMIQNLADNCELIKFNANEEIFQEGTKLHKIFFVVKGKVSVQKSIEPDRKEEILAGSLLFDSLVSNHLIADYFADATLVATNKVKILAVTLNVEGNDDKMISIPSNDNLTKLDSENGVYNGKRDNY